MPVQAGQRKERYKICKRSAGRGLKPLRDEKDQDSVSSAQAERSRQEEHLEETLAFSLGEGQWNKKTRVCNSQELWFLNKSFPFSY